MEPSSPEIIVLNSTVPQLWQCLVVSNIRVLTRMWKLPVLQAGGLQREPGRTQPWGGAGRESVSWRRTRYERRRRTWRLLLLLQQVILIWELRSHRCSKCWITYHINQVRIFPQPRMMWKCTSLQTERHYMVWSKIYVALSFFQQMVVCKIIIVGVV